MAEFWDTSFRDKRMMWGEEASLSALIARDCFEKSKVKNVMIPGIGYGRNAKPFLNVGMTVVGIEISETAIDLAKTEMGLGAIIIHHGSVTNMPFDHQLFDGIFCYALIHLLEADQRAKLIQDCYAQLAPGGMMIFTAVSIKSKSYGKGTRIGENRFEQHGGAKIFFYDEQAIHHEFDDFGLCEIRETTESNSMPFLMAICKKEK